MGERHREPRNGAKEFLQRRFFRPVPGLVNWLREPTAHAVGYVVSPSGLGALVAAMPLCITPLQILRSARRFCRNPSPGGASDRSPVREHWERRERQASPGTGRKNWSRVLLSPRAGLANLLYGPRARALGYSLAPSGLRKHFIGCGYAALRGGQSWPQPPAGGSPSPNA